MHNDIPLEKVTNYLKGFMEDMTLANSVLELATKLEGKRIMQQHLTLLPTQTEADPRPGYWKLEQFHSPVSRNLRFLFKDPTLVSIDNVELEVAVTRTAAWDPKFIEENNRGWFAAKEERNAARAKLLGDQQALATMVNSLNYLRQAHKLFADHYTELESLDTKHLNLADLLIRDVAKLEFRQPLIDGIRRAWVLTIFPK